jgi:hypothetical protein
MVTRVTLCFVIFKELAADKRPPCHQSKAPGCEELTDLGIGQSFIPAPPQVLLKLLNSSSTGEKALLCSQLLFSCTEKRESAQGLASPPGVTVGNPLDIRVKE